MAEQLARPQSSWKRVALALGLPAAIILGIIWVIDWSGRSQTAEAQVAITAENEVTWLAEEELKRGYDVQYQFVVAGQTYQGASTRDESYRPGGAYKACYNPSDPQDHSLVSLARKCGRGLLFYR